MTPTQVWDSLCSYIFQLFPDCIVRKQYRPIEDIENLAETNRPMVWVGLSSCNISSVDVNAGFVEDSYTFRIILAWKLRNSDDPSELDNRLNTVQQFLTLFRHKGVDVDGSRLYFGLPSCDSPFDEDLLTSPGIFVSTCSIPLSVYRNLIETIPSVPNSDDSSNPDISSDEETSADSEND